MTGEVVSTPPDATFHQMAAAMRRHAISALPVVDEHGTLLGIVSEADLLSKESPLPRWRWWRPEGRSVRTRRLKVGGVRAADIMTVPAISIEARATLAAAARLLDQHHIKRLVVRGGDGQVAGIVSRHDLLAAFTRSDAEIRRDIVEGVIPRWVMVDPARLHVEVRGGVVRLEGVVDLRSDAEILTHLVRGLDGVVDVVSAVTFHWDDRDVALPHELHVS